MGGPSGQYVDGMNLHQYVQSNPVASVDPPGTWKRSAEGGHVWCAESGDTLWRLAAKREYGGNAQNWPCLWPTHDTEDHGYPNTIHAGDKYDASNVAAHSGPSAYINMDTIGAYGATYQEDRPQAKKAPTATEVYGILKDVSGEGATPIHYFEILAHSWNWPGISAGNATNNKKMKDLTWKREDFRPGDYSPDSPTPSFSRAQQQKGPHRCWFTRRARGYSFACGGYSFGKAFASVFLRRGARIYTSPQNVSIINDDPWFGRNDWGFKRDNTRDWYSDIDEFLRSPGWAFVSGRL